MKKPLLPVVAGYGAILLVAANTFVTPSVRRGFRNLALVGALAAIIGSAHAALLTTDIPLNVTLQPNSTYTVSTDVTISAVDSLLGLIGLTDSPLQILDGDGNVIGTLPAQDLIDLLTGLTGGVTRQLDLVITTAGNSVVNPVVRVIDNPIIQYTPPVISSPSTSPQVTNKRPTVKITGHKLRGKRMRLMGTAKDDRKVGHVEVMLNNRLQHVTGKTKYVSKLKLRAGRNRISVRAFDATGKVSAPKRLAVTVAKK